MKLTPLDIRKQEFKRTLRGHDPDEVEAFLSMVADELELLLRERNHLNDELIKLRTQLKDYQQVEHTLHETLVKAQNTVEESRQNSKREAEIIIREAELKAEQILKESRDELQDLKNEIRMLKIQKESFIKRLQHLLESQVELLEVMGIDDVIDSEDENYRRASARGRMPRPFQPEEREKAPDHPSPQAEHKEEPRIVRGEKSHSQHQRIDLSSDFREQGVKQEKHSNRDEDESSSDRLSDQIII